MVGTSLEVPPAVRPKCQMMSQGPAGATTLMTGKDIRKCAVEIRGVWQTCFLLSIKVALIIVQFLISCSLWATTHMIGKGC